MQNTVYERKQNGEGFFSLPAVTYSRFGNCPANGLVTEQPQYSVIICIFSTWQNAETKLISNGLRFIFTCPLFLAQPITFHNNNHRFAIPMKDKPTAPSKSICRKHLPKYDVESLRTSLYSPQHSLIELSGKNLQYLSLYHN